MEIVTEVDPLGLIAGGAPDDEYEVEALEIFTTWKSSRLNADNCLEKLEEIFLRSFGEGASINEASLQEISEALLRLN